MSVEDLEHSDSAKRLEAIETLGEQDEAEIERHAKALVGLMQDPDEEVRLMAVMLLDRCSTAALAAHAPVLFAQLVESDDEDVRWGAAAVMKRLDALTLKPGAWAILVRAQADPSSKVRSELMKIATLKFSSVDHEEIIDAHREQAMALLQQLTNG
jgi:HEAT repeat protein